MATYGITGGNGFIGGHVSDELQRRGHKVVVFDHSKRVGEKPTSPQGDVELFLGDIRDRTAVIEFAAHVDGIVHLAAVLGTQETIQQIADLVSNGVITAWAQLRFNNYNANQQFGSYEEYMTKFLALELKYA
jgi:nucleoside-diphosphate-sugar epimerase